MRVLMDRIHVGHGSQIGPMTLFPVWTEAAPARFDVAPLNTLQAGELDQPVISTVRLHSEHPLPVLVPEGTLLAGGMQTRVLRRDAWVPAGARVDADAYCVEQGRWRHQGGHQVVGRAPITVLAASRQIAGNRPRNNDSGQGSVWDSVSRQEARYGRRPTSSLVDVMNDSRREERSSEQEQAALRLQQLMSQLASYRLLRGQSGILVGIGGHPVLLEVLSNSRGFMQHVEFLLKGLAVDAAALPMVPTPGRRARRFAEVAMNTSLHETDHDQSATHILGENDLMDIRALQVRSSAVHTVAINKIHDLVLAA